MVESAVVCEIPLTLMLFPKFVLDKKYCFDKLSEVFTLHPGDFVDKWEKLSDPDMIKFGK